MTSFIIFFYIWDLTAENGLRIPNCCLCSKDNREMKTKHFSMFHNCLNAVKVFHSHWLRISFWNGELYPSVNLTEIKSILLSDRCTESQLQQMPGHSHQLLILFQHFRLSDFDCHLFHTKDFKARHKCLLNFIWLISLKSIFVTSKDSTCCSPRQNYSELIWRRNEACWISTIALQCDWNSVIFIAGN